MARLLLLVVFVLGAAFSRGYGLPSSGTDDLRIYGGHKISVEEAPFMVALHIRTKNEKKRFFCGGSIINDRFIVTAAHCLDLPMLLSVKASVGSDNTNDPHKILIEMKDKFCHEKFDPKKSTTNDICLIKLKKPLKFGSKVAKVTLPDENLDLKDGTLVNISGWGVTEQSPSRRQSSLRQVTVPIKSDCPFAMDYKIQICIRTEGHASCYGDSGGPLTIGRVLVGIVSGHRGECGTGGAFHTRVSSYVQWIKTTIKHNLH